MGSFLTYSLVSGLILAILLCAYRLFLAGEKQLAFNRGVILSIYIISFSTYPLMQLADKMSSVAVTTTFTEIANHPISITNSGNYPSQPIWGTILIWIFVIGMSICALHSIITWTRIIHVIAKGRKYLNDGFILVLTDNFSLAPFSWMRYMVMNRADYDACPSAIATHEFHHISSFHWLDLLLAQAVIIINWFNPAAWFMRDELMLVHEYQADMAVINAGHDPREYQMLLIKKAVGARFPSLANSLNHSKLKKRITMMYKSKSSGEQRLKALALMPALGLALMAAALPQAKAAISTIDNSRMLPDKVTNFSSDVKDCAEKPGFMLQVNGEYSITDSVIKAENPISIVIPKDNPDIKNAPKYYIDGKEVSESELNSIKPEDIERISVFRNPDRTCVTLKEEDSFENSHILTPDGKHNSPEITIMVDGKKISKKELKAIKCENIDSISIDKTKDIIYFTLKKTTEK